MNVMNIVIFLEENISAMFAWSEAAQGEREGKFGIRRTVKISRISGITLKDLLWNTNPHVERDLHDLRSEDVEADAETFDNAEILKA
jgi:hypothetical protein